ncbi:MAG: diphthine--ammonia ligase [Firmicutes bacterium]|nr:diphthine--ammonia ligase [Bacillota bacterium]
MKFVMSYSCGKDSTLALHKMIELGHEPVALITMVNEDSDRAFFHGADLKMIKAYSEALGIPVLITKSSGEHYHLAMEKSLKEAVLLGAEAACFGDIDIEGNRAWSEERCSNAGLPAVFPLWHKDRAENVCELVGLGYKCLIKSINNTLLPEELLGKIIDAEVIGTMKNCGIDICGENGEYHTLVVDGPVFHKPLEFSTGQILKFGDFSVIEVNV